MMKIYLFVLSVLFPTITSLLFESNHKLFSLHGNVQGTTYHINYFAKDSLISYSEINRLFNNLDSSLSLYNQSSLVSSFNGSGKGVRMDKHLRAVISKSLVISKAFNAFDITVKPLVDIWGFGVVRSSKLPDSLDIKQLQKCIGTDKIYLQKSWLLKAEPCVQIDVNGIAQGYSVDVIAEYLTQQGINDFMVEIGGEVKIKGLNRHTRKPFTIGIEAPTEDKFLPPMLQRKVYLKEGALTTSGNYRNFKQNGSKKISHLINPITGFPLNNEMISVTVWAKDAITADAFDNVFMGIGLKKSLQYLQSKKNIGAYFIYLKSDGTVSDTTSLNFPPLVTN